MIKEKNITQARRLSSYVIQVSGMPVFEDLLRQSTSGQTLSQLLASTTSPGVTIRGRGIRFDPDNREQTKYPSTEFRATSKRMLWCKD